MAIAVREIELSKVTEGGLRLAGVLRAIRKEKGWKQREVAERWGMSVDGYRPYEQGRRQLRVTQIPLLATALKIKPDDLARRIGISLADETDGTATLRAEAARELATLVVTELADVLTQLEGLEPTAWREVIETWRMQPGFRPTQRPRN